MTASLSPARAQEFLNEAEGKTVTDVRVRYIGEATVDAERIKAFMSTKKGNAFSEITAREDVKTLYESGVADNVRIVTEPVGSGVRVVVLVQAKTSLSGILFEGNSRYSAGRLRREIDSEVGTAINELELQEGLFNIEEYYKKKGFSDVRVRYRTVPDEERSGYSNVVYTINEGQRYRLRNIVFSGNTSVPDKELRKVMKVKEKTVWAFWRGKLDRDLLEEDLLAVENEFRNRGHMNARVVDWQRQRIGDSDKVDLVIQVDEGPIYTISGVNLGGNKVFPTSEFEPIVKLKPGDLYSAKVIS
ncbi:MAG: POTRA domain-containing protein, partial [Verrucomicrobiota bacterium]